MSTTAAPRVAPELDAWLDYMAHGRAIAASTCRNYRWIITNLNEFLAGRARTLLDARAEDLQAYCGAHLHARGNTPNSRRVAVSAVRGYYRWLVERRILSASPAAAVPYPRLARTLPVAIPLQSAERIMAQPALDTFKGVRDVAILSVLLGCGPRVSGISNLNEEDLLFYVAENGIEELTIKFREKGGHERLVPAPDETRLLLRAYLGHPELESADRRTETGERVLFVNLQNHGVPQHERRGEHRRIRPRAVWELMRRYGRRARVEDRFLHPHAFRHLYGKEMIENDVPMLVAQALMGHTDPKSTKIYSHIADRKLRKMAMDANPLRRIRTPASELSSWLKARVSAKFDAVKTPQPAKA